MEASDIIFLASKSGNIRFHQQDVELILEKFEEITGTTGPMDFRKFFWILFEKAIAQQKLKEVPVSDPEQAAKIAELEEIIQKLRNTQPVEEDSDIAQLKQAMLPYLIILERQEGINNLSEVWNKLIAAAHKANAWILNPEEIAYVKTIQESSRKQ